MFKKQQSTDGPSQAFAITLQPFQIGDSLNSEQEDDQSKKPKFRQSYRNANWLSSMFVGYAWKMISSVNKNHGEMKEEFIENMNLTDDQTERVYSVFRKHFDSAIEKNSNNGLKSDYKAVFQNSLLKTLKWDLMKTTLFSFTGDAFGLFNAYYISQVISFIKDKDAPWTNAVYILTIYLCSTLIASIFRNKYQITSAITFLQLRKLVIQALYDKIGKLSMKSLIETNSGKVVTIISSDFLQVERMMAMSIYVLTAPLLNLAGFFYLGFTAGYQYALVALCFWIIQLFMQQFLGNKVRYVKLKESIAKTNLMKLTNDIIVGARTLKCYAWEKHYQVKIEKERKVQRKYLQLLNLYQQIGSIFIQYGGLMVSLFIFIPMYIQGQDFSSANIFSISMILNLIFSGINAGVYGGFMAMKNLDSVLFRMSEVLEMEEYSVQGIENDDPTTEPQIKIEDGQYSWGFRVCELSELSKSDKNLNKQNKVVDSFKLKVASDAEVAISEINIEQHSNSLTVVVGPVGSGKSTLLLSLMGETKVCSTSHFVKGTIAYVEQEPFIMSGTIKDNILFGRPFDRHRLDQAIQYSELTSDMMIFQDGEDTTIGDRGINISGGQKARISMARALYSDSDIYLLDDPLSAVDPEVANKLFHSCINGFLQNKIRILVTHQLQYLRDCKRILILQEGVQKQFGSYNELIQNGYNIEQILSLNQKYLDIERKRSATKLLAEVQSRQFDKTKLRILCRGYTAFFDLDSPSRVGGLSLSSPKSIYRLKNKTADIQIYENKHEDSHSFIFDDELEEVKDDFDEEDEKSGTSEDEDIPPNVGLEFKQKGKLFNSNKKEKNIYSERENIEEMFIESVSLDQNDLELKSEKSESVSYQSSAKSKEKVFNSPIKDVVFISPSKDASLRRDKNRSLMTSSKKGSFNLKDTQKGSFKLLNQKINSFGLKETQKGSFKLRYPSPKIDNIIEEFDEQGGGHNLATENMETQRQTLIAKDTMKLNPFSSTQIFKSSQKVQEDNSEQKVHFRDYFIFFHEAWGSLGIIFLISIYAVMVVLQMGPAYYLSQTVAEYAIDPKVSTYITLYSLACGLTIIISIFRSLYNFNLVLVSSSNYYQKMIENVLRASIQFFDMNPIGKIVTRFSKDMAVCDTQICMVFVTTFNGALKIMQILITISIVNYYMILPIVFTCICQYVIVKIGSPVLLQSQGMDSNYRSPLHQDLITLINGLVTFRSYDQIEFFRKKFVDNLEICANATFCYILSNRWMGLRLDISSLMIIASTSIFCVCFKNRISTYLLTYSLQMITDLVTVFTLTIRFQQELSNNMMCTKRIQQYTHLESEGELMSEQDQMRIDEKWPLKGEIIFTCVTMRYRDDLEPALKNVSFKVESGMKVGIVGRTGSGKSSILQVLFRLIKLEAGSIEIDNIDIRDVGLHLLRSNIGFIPQMPFLLQGTLYENLDPFNEHTIEEVEDALEKVQLLRYVRTFKEGIMAEILESNQMFSVGQKQLICLARAILRNTKILVLDEATANIDMETDNMIQQKIRELFKDNTVLIIAHRLATVIDADRILVMNEGRALEFDYPFKLLTQNDTDKSVTRLEGYLAQMVLANGEKNAQSLFDVAKQKYQQKQSMK